MILGLIGALAAAGCYGAASVFQAVGSRRAAAAGHAGGTGGERRLEIAGLVRGLAGQLTYVAGLALDGVGFAASVLALRTLPLFVVQAAVAASVAVTALLAHYFLGVALRRFEIIALAVLGVGLVALAASAEPRHAAALPSSMQLLLVAGVGAVLVSAVASVQAPQRYASAAFATVAGLAFTGVGVAARVLVVPRPLWRLVLSPVALALAGYGVLGLLLYAAALQRGSVTTATAILFAVETVLPAAIGLVLLGDRPGAGYAGAAVAGFVLTVGGALALARHGTVDAAARM